VRACVCVGVCVFRREGYRLTHPYVVVLIMIYLNLVDNVQFLIFIWIVLIMVAFNFCSS